MIPSDHPIVQTTRLLIQPLSYPQLLLYTQPDNALEKSLGLEPYPRTIPGELREALERLILPSAADPANNYLFSTLWTIIDKERKVMVGDLCFKGAPNERGEVEIGYGTYSDFGGKGYMTEAVGGMVQWAMSEPTVTSILAETDEANLPSHKTLSRNNFVVYQRIDNVFWWRLDKRIERP